MDIFTASLAVEIRQENGPALDRSHVLAWASFGGRRFEGANDGFRFRVCVVHPDPGECDQQTCGAADSTYRALVMDAKI